MRQRERESKKEEKKDEKNKAIEIAKSTGLDLCEVEKLMN